MSNSPSPVGGLSGPTWQELYKNAVLELDTEKIPRQIAKARDAIRERAKELRSGSSLGESHELTDALRSLDLLEVVIAREESAQ